MDRKSYLLGRKSITNIDFVPVVKQQEEVEVNERNPLLDFIFAPDSRGCLVGDLAHYMGANTNAEVRQFIEQNLMREHQSGSNPLGFDDATLNHMKSVIGDDEVALFSRGHEETQEQYAQRIGNYFAKQRSENVAKASYAREKARLEKLGYTFDN